jgi:hypothetical protein
MEPGGSVQFKEKGEFGDIFGEAAAVGDLVELARPFDLRLHLLHAEPLQF